MNLSAQELIQQLKAYLTATEEEIDARIKESPIDLNTAGFDPWGLNPKVAKRAALIMHFLYRHYFRVETTGIENIPEGRVLIIANHGGQLPIDGLLLGLSLFFDAKPPRIVRGMVERWVPAIPFISTFFTRVGQVLGDPVICRDLLNHNEAVMVFPEGVRGSGKTIFEKYELKTFGTGFVRLALETKSPMVPVGIIGCEEAYPGLLNLKPLAKLFSAPYFPMTPFFPWLGPLGAIPLPTKVTIRFGEPIVSTLDPDASDAQVKEVVRQVQHSMKSEIRKGLKRRGNKIFTGSGR